MSLDDLNQSLGVCHRGVKVHSRWLPASRLSQVFTNVHKQLQPTIDSGRGMKVKPSPVLLCLDSEGRCHDNGESTPWYEILKQSYWYLC